LYEGITEPALHSVLADLEGLDFDVFQVDDGWQRKVGDWEINGKFPSGMPALADRIRAAGLKPGLWLAPLLVHEGSQAFADHPDWMLRDEAGAPAPAGWNWGGRLHALDATNPDALAHACDILPTAVEWGFDYLKLDFLCAGALPGVRSSPVERHHAHREAVEAFRSAVGDDVVLLACGAPVIPSLGVFDAVRIGPDVAYFRTRFCLLTAEQKQVIADLTRVCRFRATSDIPATLDPHERDALAGHLREDAAVRQLARYRWMVGDREVDFAPIAAQAPVMLAMPDGP
jgi:alpha-galactosidase